MKTRLKACEPENTGKKSIRMDLLEVYNACLKNASNLIDEAKLLLEHKHYARAFFLGYAAFEELGKSQLVADHFNDLISEKEFNSAFKDHKIKIAYIKRYVAVPESKDKEWWIEYDREKAASDILYRMQSLYIDFKEGKIETPDRVINKDMAEDVVKGAGKYIKDIIKIEYLTERIGTKAFTK